MEIHSIPPVKTTQDEKNRVSTGMEAGSHGGNNTWHQLTLRKTSRLAPGLVTHSFCQLANLMAARAGGSCRVWALVVPSLLLANPHAFLSCVPENSDFFSVASTVHCSASPCILVASTLCLYLGWTAAYTDCNVAGLYSPSPGIKNVPRWSSFSS